MSGSMTLLPLDMLGARTDKTIPEKVEFGVYLPGISPLVGDRVFVKVIHEHDQFLQEIPPTDFELAHSQEPAFASYEGGADYWSCTAHIPDVPKKNVDSAWGNTGRYLYRYCVKRDGGYELDWIIDPFAREFGVGKLSAFTLGYEKHEWSATDAAWKTPALDDLIVYELMLNEFGGGLEGCIRKLDYLLDMGVNCIEVMPVSNISDTVQWGYMPVGYFGVDERFGKRSDMQRLIDEAHQRGIAVILDAVYSHTDESFPYRYAYANLQRKSPMNGPYAEDESDYGGSTDFSKKFTRDFYFTVNHHWLRCYHVDGFRYDYVPGYWDGSPFEGYSSLVYHTFKMIEDAPTDWHRFHKGESINLIQCAEDLKEPTDVLNRTYSNCTWQDETLSAAEKTARGEPGSLQALGHRLGLMNYPSRITANDDTLPKTAFQYIESHDHPRFICNFGGVDGGSGPDALVQSGNRDLWYKTQPYLIGLFTGKGIPMLWQGQEFCENYWVPSGGMGRVLLYRPMHWEYFYTDQGKKTVGLVRKLAKLRQKEQFKTGEHYFYDWDELLNEGLLFFTRNANGSFSLVALNFSDQDKKAEFTFPVAGDYREELHGIENLGNVAANETRELTIPGNYGRVWTA